MKFVCKKFVDGVIAVRPTGKNYKAVARDPKQLQAQIADATKTALQEEQKATIFAQRAHKFEVEASQLAAFASAAARSRDPRASSIASKARKAQEAANLAKVDAFAASAKSDAAKDMSHALMSAGKAFQSRDKAEIERALVATKTIQETPRYVIPDGHGGAIKTGTFSLNGLNGGGSLRGISPSQIGAILKTVADKVCAKFCCGNCSTAGGQTENCAAHTACGFRDLAVAFAESGISNNLNLIPGMRDQFIRDAYQQTWGSPPSGETFAKLRALSSSAAPTLAAEIAKDKWDPDYGRKLAEVKQSFVERINGAANEEMLNAIVPDFENSSLTTADKSYLRSLVASRRQAIRKEKRDASGGGGSGSITPPGYTPPPSVNSPTEDNTGLYVGLGIGAVALIGLIAVIAFRK